MYNHQLDIFALVAKEGNFSAAAQKLYVSSSAVNQQITNLEENLNVQLFYRSRHGLQLTEAGEYLLAEIPTILSHNDTIRRNLRQIDLKNRETISVGIPHMHDVRLFYKYWGQYSVGRSAGTVRLVSPNSWNMSDMFQTYSDCDLVEYIDIGAAWQKDRSFVKLEDVRVGCSVPFQHHLSGKQIISPDDLNGEILVTANGAFTNMIRDGLNLLEEHGAKLIFEDYYSATMMDDCFLNDSIVIVLISGRPIHHGFKNIPIDWDITVPYGFSCKTPYSPALKKFLDYVDENR